jgi:anti-sigma B factor antagonist
VVRLHGEIDAFTAPRLSHDLRREVEARPALVALDLSDLEFLGVAGLNLLLEAQQLADEGGTAILLVGSPAPAVERLLGLVGWTVTTDPVNSGRDDHHQTQ